MLENMKVELLEGEALLQKRDGEIFKDNVRACALDVCSCIEILVSK